MRVDLPRCENQGVDIRRASRTLLGGRISRAVRQLNDRHPWNHNNAFHTWITTRLPAHRGEALDVGCGRGELLAVLAEHFDHVHGIEIDAGMRQASMSRCAGLAHVTVDSVMLENVPTGADLVSMIAVLHHLDLDMALKQVRRILNPGGKFLCVGLARPDSVTDHAWDVASMITNPIIGYIRHPWVAHQLPDAAPIPVKDPELTFNQIRATVHEVLPGAEMRHHLGFRHTIEWTKPAPSPRPLRNGPAP